MAEEASEISFDCAYESTDPWVQLGMTEACLRFADRMHAMMMREERSIDFKSLLKFINPVQGESTEIALRALADSARNNSSFCSWIGKNRPLVEQIYICTRSTLSLVAEEALRLYSFVAEDTLAKYDEEDRNIDMARRIYERWSRNPDMSTFWRSLTDEEIRVFLHHRHVIDSIYFKHTLDILLMHRSEEEILRFIREDKFEDFHTTMQHIGG